MIDTTLTSANLAQKNEWKSWLCPKAAVSGLLCVCGLVSGKKPRKAAGRFSYLWTLPASLFPHLFSLSTHIKECASACLSHPLTVPLSITPSTLSSSHSLALLFFFFFFFIFRPGVLISLACVSLRSVFP